jgi:hypothetical protein
MKRSPCVVLLALLLVILLSGPISSQTVQGVVTGTVTDPSGGSVPKATVTITNQGTNISQSVVTSSDGSYRFSLVPTGTYTIEVKATGFATMRAAGIVVEASQTVPFPVKLEIAKGSEVIEVTGAAPLVQTATSDLALQIDRSVIESAPLVDRDIFATLPFLAPQVMPGIDMLATSGGAREAGTSYLLNGGDDNDDFSAGGVNITPPLESVQDFSIKTNQMSAEYGRGGGAVVTADQKSGTNKFHGSLYEFNRNALLNANSYFYDKALHNDTQHLLSARPKYIKNQFGGEVDGPIRKDKTFFSAAYDRNKLLASTTNANTFVPTSAGAAYVLANGGPLAQQILKAYPPTTSDNYCPSIDSGPGGITGSGTGYWGNGLPNPVGCLSFADPQTDTIDTYYGRVDHTFNEKDRLSFTANFYRETFLDQYGGGPLTTAGPINGTTTNHFHNLTLSETHSFSPTLVNEAAVTHVRHYNVFVAGNGKNTIPSIVIDNQTGGCLGFDLGGPFEGSQVQGFTQDRWDFKDSVTWTKGRHGLKFGFGLQAGILYRNWDLGLPGYYEFGELSAVNSPIVTSTGTVYPASNPNTPGIPSCPINGQITPACDAGSNSTLTQTIPVLQSNGTLANVVSETNANFTNEYPYFMETSIDPATGAKADAYRHYTYHDYYLYAQDDWKVTSKLTLNLGLRWDRYGAPSEVHNVLAQFTNLGCNILLPSCTSTLRTGPVSRMWPTQNHDFGPRIGFAWDPFGNGKMAVRGGYGIYFDRIFDNIWSNGAWNPPFYGLADFENDLGDAIYYSNPASIGPGYDPSIPGCEIPNAPVHDSSGNLICAGHRVSIRTMDQNMKDSSVQNYYFGVERQFLGSYLVRAAYQGSMGRHLPMLENYNRYDGAGYGVASAHSLSVVRPNPLYTGFNYRSNSVSSNYNSLYVEVQKRYSNGLQFQTSYTYSKLLDVNSELFAGCSAVSLTSGTYPYYYTTNTNQRLQYGRAGFDHRHAYKFSVTYDLPFYKDQKGFVGHALGGWQIGSLFQLYSGHPFDVTLQSSSFARIRARDSSGALILDQNGHPYNIGGDYNLDGVYNDHPNFVGNMGSVYSGASPADGIFVDNNRIGCGEAGVPSTVDYAASSSHCVSNPNKLFANPAYPTGPTPYLRFGTLGRDVFQGPKFVQLDMALNKTFRLTEGTKLDFRVQAQNLLNHPSFECIEANLSDALFGKAQCLAQQGLGAPQSRIMSLGLRFAF